MHSDNSAKGDVVTNHHQSSGRNVALPDENRPAWSPQDQAQSLTHRSRGSYDEEEHDVSSWRDRNYHDDDWHATGLDPRRWEGGRGSELGYYEPMGYRSRSYGRGRGRGHGLPRPAGRDEAPRYPVSGAHSHRGTGPHRGKGPVGYRRSDERIHELVCETLTDDDQLDASQIEVSVNDGSVTLSGVVDARHAKLDAEDCVYSVWGVRGVQNLLRVAGGPLSGKTTPTGWSAPASDEVSESEAFPEDQKTRP